MVDPFGHEALLYHDTTELLAGTTTFLSEGVEADDALLVVTPEPGLSLLREKLGRLGERVTFLDMSEVGRNPGRILPGVLMAFAASNADRRVRVVSEAVWKGRSEAEYPACVQHEALINSAFAGRRATIRCPYDLSSLDERAVADAERTHPVLVERNRSRVSAAYDAAAAVAEHDQPLPPPPGGVVAHPFEARQLAAMRHLVFQHALDSGLAQNVAEDLVLAVNELTTNSVVHATGGGVLRIWSEDDAVVCEVRDNGTFGDSPAGRIPPSPSSSFSGYGLMMTNMLCDLVRIHTSPEGTAIRVHVRR
ncbi:sensor histidine kinase [Umezawaea beigongshangensis]|uniref:sensor histidine kinase n=1 Tax=Umezawaea beigongshangensis TaxID=2780383 RepID=UPI0018F21312|nr:sensor histidine kinase [Umezawaea beigongshangensis]